MKNVFIIGARGYKTPYGGWETFIRGLLDNWKNKNVHFYVYEKSTPENNGLIEKINNNLTLFYIHVPNQGGFTMMKYDMVCSKHAYNFTKENNIKNTTFYYLGLRIGPYVFIKRRKYKKLGIYIFENAAGLEWKRTKWNRLVQVYLFISAYLMAKSSDLLICDSEGILDVYNKLIKSNKPRRIFIPYGTYLNHEIKKNDKTTNYYIKYGIKENDFYLVVSRFVPENNYELILREFMNSDTNKDLVLVTNHEFEIAFFNKLKRKMDFLSDGRIKFVGTLYDKEILNNLRKDAFAYINGHSLGGTNPGLLEAMAITNLNIVYDVIFARQVGGDAVIYYDERKLLRDSIRQAENLNKNEINKYGIIAKKRMKDYYEWPIIVDEYEKLFMDKEFI